MESQVQTDRPIRLIYGAYHSEVIVLRSVIDNIIYCIVYSVIPCTVYNNLLVTVRQFIYNRANGRVYDNVIGA